MLQSYFVIFLVSELQREYVLLTCLSGHVACMPVHQENRSRDVFQNGETTKDENTWRAKPGRQEGNLKRLCHARACFLISFRRMSSGTCILCILCDISVNVVPFFQGYRNMYFGSVGFFRNSFAKSLGQGSLHECREKCYYIRNWEILKLL